MSLRPETLPPIPDVTAAAVRAAFPKGNLYVELRAEFGTLYTDQLFADLYPPQGRPVEVAPWRLALVVVMQYLEGLTEAILTACGARPTAAARAAGGRSGRTTHGDLHRHRRRRDDHPDDRDRLCRQKPGVLPSRSSEREAGVMMTWLRWLPATLGPVLLGLCLPLAGTLRAQGMLEEVPFDRKLVANTGVMRDQFGSALAGSGDTLVVGAPSAAVDGKSAAGAAYVFVRDLASGRWVERKRLVAQDGAASDQLAGSVAIDGDTVVLGAARTKIGTVRQGAAYVFERHAGGVDNWGQVAKLTDSSVGAIGTFGSSVAIKRDLLAVGANRGGLASNGTYNGLVTLFERDRGGPGAWGKVTTIFDSAVGDGGGSLFTEAFGSAVALDGDLLLVGADWADVSASDANDGAAYLFRRNGADRDRWDLVARLTAAEAAVCPGGRTLAEIALDSPEVRLEVERCVREGGGTTANDRFGAAVALDGDTVAVGAYLANAATGPLIGAAYVFRRDPAGADRWDQVAKLTGSDILVSTTPTFFGVTFGRTLALASDTLLVGASGVQIDGPKPGRGAAYRFERHAGGSDAWGEVARLVAADGLSWESFGAAVAIDGRNGIIGTSGYERAQGAVYLAGEDKPPAPAFAPTGELVDGGIVEGPDGLVLSTSPGAISEQLPVWIVAVPPPAEPLDANATLLGTFYNIGSSPTTTAAAGAPFGLALPVPAGADTEHLAAAVLVSARSMLDGPESGELWIPIEGTYDQARNLFIVELYTLTLQGNAIALIEDAALPPPLRPAPTPALGESGPLFDVTCHNFPAPGVCGLDEENKYELLLDASYAKLTGFGFENPHLTKTTTRQAPPNDNVVVESLPYVRIFIKATDSKGCASSSPGVLKGGSYVFLMKSMRFCLMEPPPTSTVTHELFHAFQFGTNLTQWEPIGVRLITDQNTPKDDFSWVGEGTATAAENSASTMAHDGNHPLHAIDHAITSSDDSDEYRAQDFWIYFGMKKSLGLGYLKPLLERGGTTASAAQFFSEVHATTLGDEYWGWVKNQAMEKKFKISDAMGEDKCHIDDAVIGQVSELEYPTTDPEFPNNASVEGMLLPLTAKVVRITIKEKVARTTITAGQPEGGLAYKVYLNGKTPCAEEIADNEPPPFEELEKDKIIYVILANTLHDPNSRVPYKLEVKPAS